MRATQPCANLAEGDACTASFGTGTCTLTSSSPPYYYYPEVPDAPTSSTSVPTPVVLSGPPLALIADAAAPIDGGVYADAAAGSDGGSQPELDAGAVDTAIPSDGGGYPEPWPSADAGYTYPWPSYDGGYTEPWPSYDGGYTEPWPSYDGGVYPEPEPTLTCLPTGDCSTLPEGAACTTDEQQLGSCFVGKCYPQQGPGGIDGLGVDACGNVYASEYVVGNVWRITPDGTTELLTEASLFLDPQHQVGARSWRFLEGRHVRG